VRVVAHGAIHERDSTAPLRQFVDEEHLMDIGARESIGRGEHHTLKGRERRVVAQPVQARPAQLGPAVAIVPVNVLLGEAPLRVRGDMGL